MKTDFLKRNWQIILLNIIITLCFILGYGRFGDVIVDSFREAYVPEQMLCGQALYTNIFIVYPSYFMPDLKTDTVVDGFSPVLILFSLSIL